MNGTSLIVVAIGATICAEGLQVYKTNPAPLHNCIVGRAMFMTITAGAAYPGLWVPSRAALRL
jgi:hypothetical protein